MGAQTTSAQRQKLMHGQEYQENGGNVDELVELLDIGEIIRT